MSASMCSRKYSHDFGIVLAILLSLVNIALMGPSVTSVGIIVVLLVSIIAPLLLLFPATIWFHVSNHIGRFMTKLVFSLIWFFVVLPVGVSRRYLNKGNRLQVNDFKRFSVSVMKERNHSFTSNDINNPF